jgi:DNA-binding NtrC family response regulator
MIPEPHSRIVGESVAMERLRALLPLLAASDSGVLIIGEPGTGREHLTRLIHLQSPRGKHPLGIVDCPTHTWTNGFDELFGGEGQPGVLATCAEGTIYLASVDELSVVTQGRLARFVEDAANGQIERPPRVIAASRHDLGRLVACGRFRGDLYYRLSVVRVHLPPLRERREDIAPLAHHFLERSSRELGKNLRGIAPRALEALKAHRWAGNLAELAAAVHRAAVVETGELVTVASLPPTIAAKEPLAAAS